MQYYNDKSNEKAAYLFFMFFQMFMLLMVYAFVYTSFIAVKMTILEKGLTIMTALPEIIALIAYPVVMYKTRKMFKAGKRLTAVAWLMGWASVIIVFLYFHIAQLVAA